jgi:UDP-N-acetylmuramoyl-tripeptide--D-alanyl-D-alanine ligase
VIALSALRIAEAVGGRIVAGDPAVIAESVSIDSRQAGPESCFFAIVGERHDGHDFVADAAAAGARVLVTRTPVEAEIVSASGAAFLEVPDTTAALQALGGWLRRHLGPKLVAITGSLGKTTTKELTAALLRRHFSVHATPGNLNNHWGLPLSLLGLEPTHEVMVAELAMSQPGEIRALARLAGPDVGMITNIAPAHMENFADLEAVATAKGELAEELPDAATLIVNADDERTAALGTRHAARLARVMSFGLAEGADVQARRIIQDAGSWRFELAVHGDSSVDVELDWPGRAGLSNFLAAAAAAAALEVPASSIAEAAEQLEPLPNRGAVRHLDDDITLLDETYNASPVAVATALETLAALPCDGRRIAVLGDMLEMGDWTEKVHREAGALAAEAGAHLLVAVGAQARYIAEGAARGGLDEDAIQRFDDSAEAAEWLAPRLRRGDTVLIKGSRSVHMERVVEAVTTTTAVANGATKG